MQAARPYVLAAAALAATGLVAVTPIAPRLPDISRSSQAVQLVSGGDSIFNIPLNLFYDMVNIPANELHAMQFFTDNLFMAGPWFVVSPTNLWGVDPGDPTHFMSVMNFLVPFPALSGMDSPETTFDAGLGQQLWGFMAAELPTSAGCDALACEPELPVAPVTGISGLDFFAWLPEIAQRSDLQEELFPLFANWEAVPLNDLLNGYYFNPAFDGSNEPPPIGGGPVYPFQGWSSESNPLLGGEGIPGTTTVTGPDGTVYDTAMPWSGDTYTLEPWVPFENFFNSLMAPPPTDGLGGTGIDPIYSDPTEIAQIFQAFFAGSMMFDPFTAGSPFCPGDCSMISSMGLDYPDLIKDIGNMMPGNPVINEWLADYAGGPGAPDGGANVPTADQIANAIALLQDKSYWDFQNASPPDSINPYVGDAAFFHQLWTDMGFNPPPFDPSNTYTPPTDIPVAEASTPAASVAANADATLPADLANIATMLGMTDISAFFSQLSADLAAQMQADLTALATSIGADLPADFASQLSADLLTLF